MKLFIGAREHCGNIIRVYIQILIQGRMCFILIELTCSKLIQYELYPTILQLHLITNSQLLIFNDQNTYIIFTILYRQID